MKKILLALFCFACLGTATSQAQNYDNAIGLRLGWGFGATYKHFFNESGAVEGILNYRSFGLLSANWNFIRITGLYQVHAPLDNVVEGLQWYYGGGGYVGFWGGSFLGNIDEDRTVIGIAGCLGLDYSFTDIPLNITIDWIPSINLAGGGGFGGEAGGLAVRYIF